MTTAAPNRYGIDALRKHRKEYPEHATRQHGFCTQNDSGIGSEEITEIAAPAPGGLHTEPGQARKQRCFREEAAEEANNGDYRLGTNGRAGEAYPKTGDHFRQI